MKVIIIRHGHAEGHWFNKSDFERELTDEGRELLEKYSPYLVSKFPENTLLVSSPLVRAVQTAEYFGDNILEEEFLATGDFLGLREFVDNHGHYDLIVLVGHEPTISDWVYRLTGEMLTVKKGMAIELEWPDKLIKAVKLKDYQSF